MPFGGSDHDLGSIWILDGCIVGRLAKDGEENNDCMSDEIFGYSQR